MSAITRYRFWGLDFGSTHVPVEHGGLRVTAGNILDQLENASALKPDLIINRGNRIELAASVFDPSLVTDWTVYGAGKAITSVTAFWRAYEENAGFSSAYISWQSAQGILVPVSLRGTPTSKAVLQVRIIPLWATGTLFTVATSTGTPPTVAKAFYPTSLALAGGTPDAHLLDLSIDWDIGVQFDEQVQPIYCYYDRFRLRGAATLKDLAAATLARAQGGKETITTIFTDAGIGGGNLTNTLSNCWVECLANGDQAALSFAQVA